MAISKSVLIDALWDADIDMDQVRWHYPGRGMYGTTCFGFVASNPMAAFGQLIVQLALVEGESNCFANQLIERVSTDSMGHDTIIYFPGLEIEED